MWYALEHVSNTTECWSRRTWRDAPRDRWQCRVWHILYRMHASRNRRSSGRLGHSRVQLRLHRAVMSAQIQRVCFVVTLSVELHDMSSVSGWCACEDVSDMCSRKHKTNIPKPYLSTHIHRLAGFWTWDILAWPPSERRLYAFLSRHRTGIDSDDSVRWCWVRVKCTKYFPDACKLPPTFQPHTESRKIDILSIFTFTSAYSDIYFFWWLELWCAGWIPLHLPARYCCFVLLLSTWHYDDQFTGESCGVV